MTPISENAGTLFAEATKISRPFQWKHLKPYITIQEFERVAKRALPLLAALRGVVYYSNQVVAINNSKFKDKEKNQQLAKYLYDAMKKSIVNQKLDNLQLEEAKTKYVAKQDELIAWRMSVDHKIMIARTSMTIWAQSHRNLGAGIPVPPLIDVAGFATDLVGGAARTVIP